ncbi:MAG TPA: hypothetical protein VKW06_01870 [Candidatus Angelobacter sp.]|nr:hypothetical protein [Candidatus Angelobacter sp.]
MRVQVSLGFALAAGAFFSMSLMGAATGREQKPDETQAAKSCELSEEDYSVFTAVLEALGKPEHPEEEWKNKEILVMDATGPGRVEPGQWNGWGFRSGSSAGPSAETRADFQDKDKDECRLKAGWGNPGLYKPFAKEEFAQLFQEKRTGQHDGWKEFYEKHPKAGGFWTFSRPGYSKGKDEALVYMARNCGWLCGTGHLYLLTKEDGQWKVKNRLFLWIS